MAPPCSLSLSGCALCPVLSKSLLKPFTTCINFYRLFSSTDDVVEHSNIAVDLTYLCLHFLCAFLDTLARASQVFHVCIGTLRAVLMLYASVACWIRRRASTLALMERPPTRARLQLVIGPDDDSTAYTSVDLARLVRLERWVAAREVGYRGLWCIDAYSDTISHICPLHVRVVMMTVVSVRSFQLMLKTWGETWHALLCWHVSKRASRHRMLSHSTHVTWAALRVLSLQKVVYRHSIVACHRWVVLSVVTTATMSTATHTHHMWSLYIVQEAGRHSCVTALVARLVCFVHSVHLLRDHHLGTRHFTSAVRQSRNSRCVNVHWILSLWVVHLLRSIAVRDKRRTAHFSVFKVQGCSRCLLHLLLLAIVVELWAFYNVHLVAISSNSLRKLAVRQLQVICCFCDLVHVLQHLQIIAQQNLLLLKLLWYLLLLLLLCSG